MKRFFCLLLTALMILTLFGCQKEPKATEPAPTEAPELVVEVDPARKYEDAELVFWSDWEDNTPEARVLTQAAEYFEGTTGAQVEIRWLDTGRAGLSDALAGGEKIDIFHIPGAQLSVYKAYAADLTELAGDTAYQQGLTTRIVNRSGGQLLALPYVPSFEGVYYNAEAFEACGIESVPTTWEDFLDVCHRLEAGGYEPLALDSSAAVRVFEFHLDSRFASAYWDQLKTVDGWRNCDEAIQAVQEIIDFASAGYLVKGSPSEFPAGQNKLAISNAAMVLGNTELCRQVEETTLTEVSWGMFSWPGSQIAYDAEVLVMNADTGNTQAAFAFIKLLTTGEFDQLRADVTGGIPADTANQSPIAGAAEAAAAADVAIPGRLPAGEGITELIGKLWKGEIRDAKDFAKSMDGFYAEYDLQSVG